MENRIITILTELVEINSVNRTLSDGPGDRQIAELIYQSLSALQLDAEIQEVGTNQCNVVAVVPGRDRRRSILLNAHLDTVGVDGMAEPFTLRREDDRLYGRGTYDMKGSIAIMMLLAEYFTGHPPPAGRFDYPCIR